MSKKQFIALADYIRCFNRTHDVPFSEDQISELADFCQAQNPRFNRSRWLAYIAGQCGPIRRKGKAMTPPLHPIPTTKTVCAWCQTLLSGDAESPIVSHGICPDCREEFFPRQTMPGLAEGSVWNPEPKPELN